MKPKILLTIFLLLLVINLFLFFTWYRQLNKITVENLNSSYTLTLTPNKSLETTLNKWQIWDKNFALVPPQKDKRTISSLKIVVVTSALQPSSYSHFDGPDKKNVLLSTNFKLNKDVGIISLYIKSGAITTSNQKYFSAIILDSVLKTILINSNQLEINSSDLNSMIEKVSKNELVNPFSLEAHNK